MRRLIIGVFTAMFMLHTAIAFASEEVSLQTHKGSLSGTLEMPIAVEKPDVVLIIAGSGPTNRDGNNRFAGRNNSLKFFAEALRDSGIASLRYDKRGIAASANAAIPEPELVFETFIDDAVLWGEQLRKDGRFGKLIVAGHSEGSLIGAVAATKLRADAFISISGAGRPAYEVIEEQFEKNAPQFLADATAIMDSLKKGRQVERVPEALLAVLRPDIQPYLITYFRYDPAKIVSALAMPVLIVQGTTDVQVFVKDAEMLAKSNRMAKLVIIDGMNHVLKDVPLDYQAQAESYGNPTMPLSPKLKEASTEFIKGLH